MGVFEVILGIWFAGIILAAVWTVASKQAPHQDWAKYEADLLLVKHWEECQASEDGCHWPDICTFGDCRRVPDFTREEEE